MLLLQKMQSPAQALAAWQELPSTAGKGLGGGGGRFRVLGFRVLRFRVLGFRVLRFRVLGFRV